MKPKPKTTLKQERAAKRARIKKLDKEWSEAVRARDGNICQKCGSVKGLNGAHIFGKKAHPSVRHDVENGICLCWPCHVWWGHQEPVEFYDFILARMGKRRLDALRRRANTIAK